MRKLLSAVAVLALAVPGAAWAQDARYPADQGQQVSGDEPGYDDDQVYDDDLPPVATPRTAPRGRASRDRDFGDFQRTINDPEMQDRIGDGLVNVVEVFMDLPIGGLLNAAQDMDPNARGRSSRRYSRNTTVRDLAGRDNPNLDRDMREGVRQLPRMMGVLTNAMGDMIPVLERGMEQIELDWDRPSRRR